MQPRRRAPAGGYFLLLSFTSLGVVFGDIGTSPLYAVREAFHGTYGITPSPQHVLGVLSLIFWALILIVSLKYLLLVLRADNEGEGGILTLMALAHSEQGQDRPTPGRRRLLLLMFGLFGAALLYGDGVVTPAISVLSAVEGIEVYQPAFKPYVLPLTILILIGLFVFQRRGTAVVGAAFAPITLLWFATLSVLGVRGILLAPEVLAAFNPLHGIDFLLTGGWKGYLVLGAVFLVVTGSEGMYTDMGHFGKRPIRFSWFSIVLPALMLNYLGQGALLLSDPGAAASPFFRLAPDWGLVPLIVLASMAAVVASQAVISGAFSLTMQAVQLGYCPRVEIRHTSAREFGQIYVPPINWALMVLTIWLVLEFGTSSRLAAAYGVAISSTMLVTTVFLYVVARQSWKWGRLRAALIIGPFLVAELAFFGANSLKIPHGGWVPLVLALGILMLMTTWRRGRRILRDRLQQQTITIPELMRRLVERPPTRVRGNAVYMTGNPDVAPNALVKNLEHNRVLHMRVAMLSIITSDVPYVRADSRVGVTEHGNGIYRVVARYGFMEKPDAREILRLMKENALDFPLEDTTFFLGRERLISTRTPGMATWRERLFGFMARNSQQATAYFGIPPDRVIEVGSQVEM